MSIKILTFGTRGVQLQGDYAEKSGGKTGIFHVAPDVRRCGVRGNSWAPQGDFGRAVSSPAPGATAEPLCQAPATAEAGPCSRLSRHGCRPSLAPQTSGCRRPNSPGLAPDALKLRPRPTVRKGARRLRRGRTGGVIGAAAGGSDPAFTRRVPTGEFGRWGCHSCGASCETCLVMEISICILNDNTLELVHMPKR